MLELFGEIERLLRKHGIVFEPIPNRTEAFNVFAGRELVYYIGEVHKDRGPGSHTTWFFKSPCVKGTPLDFSVFRGMAALRLKELYGKDA